jgi:N-acyl-L-homoserine lactone synthetase
MWEASRFFALGRAPHQPFTQVAARLFEGIFACGLEQGWSSVVAVSDVRLERYVRSLGIEVYRFTEPLMIGSTRTMAGWAAVTEEHRARASRAGHSTLVQDEAA